MNRKVGSDMLGSLPGLETQAPGRTPVFGVLHTGLKYIGLDEFPRIVL
jgi:hypothetical protein